MPHNNVKRRPGLPIKSLGQDEVVHVRLSEIQPSPENDKLYRPVCPDDPEVDKLAEFIRRRGLLEPIVVTLDGFVVSGHRQLCACIRAGLDKALCRRLPIRRSDDLEAFVQLLREYNRQRDKTNAEKLNEELVSMNPNDTHRKLFNYRRAKAAINMKPLEIGAGRRRKRISPAKEPMLKAILRIIEEQREFLPLSDRRIHYALLNNPPLTHASKPKSYCQ